MRNDELDGLIALKLVSERKSFSEAAKELALSPQAVSKLIKQLETRLGAQLLARTTRSTRPTEAGEKFLEAASPSIERILSAINSLRSNREHPAGLLRLNVPRHIYPICLSEHIHSFRRAYPDVAVELCIDDAVTDVIGAGFDAGIRMSDILVKDMVAVKLFGPTKFIVAASPRYLAQKERPTHPRELLQHECILVRTGDRLYDQWEFQHRGKDIKVQVKPGLIFNDSLVAIDAMLTGMGISYTTEHAIQDKLRSGECEAVLNSFAPRSEGYYLYYPKHSQLQPKLRAFIDHIRKATASMR